VDKEWKAFWLASIWWSNLTATGSWFACNCVSSRWRSG